ncbi:hypothetical protein AGIG_G22643 [Arapaima gigas]
MGDCGASPSPLNLAFWRIRPCQGGRSGTQVPSGALPVIGPLGGRRRGAGSCKRLVGLRSFLQQGRIVSERSPNPFEESHLMLFTLETNLRRDPERWSQEFGSIVNPANLPLLPHLSVAGGVVTPPSSWESIFTTLFNGPQNCFSSKPDLLWKYAEESRFDPFAFRKDVGAELSSGVLTRSGGSESPFVSLSCVSNQPAEMFHPSAV